MRLHRVDRGLALRERDGRLAGPASGRDREVGAGEERSEGHEVGVGGLEPEGDVLRQLALGNQDRLFAGELDAVALHLEAFEHQAVRPLREAEGERPGRGGALRDGLREAGQIRPTGLQRLLRPAVRAPRPLGGGELGVDAALHLAVRQGVREDAELRGVHVERGADGHHARGEGDVEAGRRPAGGVAQRALHDEPFGRGGFELTAEIEAGQRTVPRLELEAHAARRQRARILGGDGERRFPEGGGERIGSEALGAERLPQGRREDDVGLRFGQVRPHRETGPGDAGPQVDLAGAVDAVARDAEAQEGAVGQGDATGGGIRTEDDARQCGLAGRGGGDRGGGRGFPVAQVELEALGFELFERVGAEQAGEEPEVAGDAGRLELQAIRQGEVDTLGREAAVELGFDLRDAALDLGVGEERLHARPEGFGAQLPVDPEEGATNQEGEDTDGPKGEAKGAGHRTTPSLPPRFWRATKSPMESLPSGGLPVVRPALRAGSGWRPGRAGRAAGSGPGGGCSGPRSSSCGGRPLGASESPVPRSR